MQETTKSVYNNNAVVHTQLPCAANRSDCSKKTLATTALSAVAANALWHKRTASVVCVCAYVCVDICSMCYLLFHTIPPSAECQSALCFSLWNVACQLRRLPLTLWRADFQFQYNNTTRKWLAYVLLSAPLPSSICAHTHTHSHNGNKCR